MKITARNNDFDEIKIKKILKTILNNYDIPIFTEEILIEKGTIPHSHPILTLNTRSDDFLVVLKTFIHEQFHWFGANHYRFAEMIQFLKEKYKDDEKSDENKFKDSFYIHIIVCFNTRNTLKALVSKKDLEYIYSQWQPYPKTEKFIEENFNEIAKDLSEFEMIYMKKKKGKKSD